MSMTDNIFSPRSWDDVRRKVAIRLRLTWKGATQDQIDDAVSEAMSHLVDYWLGTRGAITEDRQRNFDFAVRYAERYGNKLIAKEMNRAERLWSPEEWDAMANTFAFEEDGYEHVVNQMTNIANAKRAERRKAADQEEREYDEAAAEAALSAMTAEAEDLGLYND